jgi:hypothetical protein
VFKVPLSKTYTLIDMVLKPTKPQGRYPNS